MTMPTTVPQTPPACAQCGGTLVDISQGGLIEYGCSRLCGERWYPPTVYSEIVDMDEPPQRGRPRKPVVTVAVTHCPQGHEYTPENTYMNGGSRNCRACRVNKKHLSREEQKRARAERERQRHAAKSTCKNGHAWTDANIQIIANGSRRCLLCQQAIIENRHKDICPNGHPQTPGNVRYRSDTKRGCSACDRQRQRDRRALKRQDANKLWQQQQNGVAA